MSCKEQKRCMALVKLFSVSSKLLVGSSPVRSALARGKRAARRACPVTSFVSPSLAATSCSRQHPTLHLPLLSSATVCM